jgi:hypothetical protein
MISAMAERRELKGTPATYPPRRIAFCLTGMKAIGSWTYLMVTLHHLTLW